MVNIKSPKCRCGRAQPAFGMPGDARATCCATCKEDGMVNIKNPNAGVAEPNLLLGSRRCSGNLLCPLQGGWDGGHQEPQSPHAGVAKPNLTSESQVMLGQPAVPTAERMEWKTS